MARYKKLLLLLVALATSALLFASYAAGNSDNASTTATTNVMPPPAQTLTLVPRPQNILDLMKARGEQDAAAPTIKIVSPAKDAVINGSTVELKLALSGDLKGYMPHKDPATGKKPRSCDFLDNQAYEAYYELGQPFELRNVTAGKHTLRVFPSRPWHESYKNSGAFQMVKFTVKGGGDPAKPTTTSSGQMMAPAHEGKDFPPSTAGDVNPSKPLLTYSRPKGEYKGADAASIMIDFWLSGAKLKGDGGQYRVRYIIDDDDPKFIDKWEPIWLSGWIAGKHTVRLELLDKDGRPVDNGGYNTTSREISVVK